MMASTTSGPNTKLTFRLNKNAIDKLLSGRKTEIIGSSRELIAEPRGRELGAMKRILLSVLKKAGYKDISRIFPERDGSGYRVYATKRTGESVADVDPSGGRTTRDIYNEFQKEAKKVTSDLEKKLKKFDPDDVEVRISTGRDGKETIGHVVVFITFGEGHAVTPLEFL